MVFSKRTHRSLFIAMVCSLIGLAGLTPAVLAQSPSSSPGQGFSLQVTPSPLVATIKPGERSTLELRIRNTNSDTQDLKMGMRAFSVNSQTGEVNLGDNVESEIADFVTFSQSNFSLKAGEIMTQKINVDTPQNAGFTYSFAITIAKQVQQKPQDGTASIEGSVAVFTLLNVEREGATRKFELGEFATNKRVYEYLPASFDLKLRNTGNTIIQPRGNIFIQRKGSDTEPITTLPINAAGGYILPNTNRTLNSVWNSGFPRYETTTDGNGKSNEKLAWRWDNLSDFRFGKYTAKVVAIYDDGQRDVPVTTEITFWVIPWRILGIISLIVILMAVGTITLLKRSTDVIKHRKKTKPHDQESS